MRNERHKRKETVSLILVSNIDNASKSCTFSVGAFRTLVGLAVLLILVILVAGIYSGGVRLKAAGFEKQALEANRRVLELEAETLALEEERTALQLELETLEMEKEIEEKEAEEERNLAATAKNLAAGIPRIYPSDGVGVLKKTFSEDHPYLSIAIPGGDNVVATGDGVILAVDYHDDYVHSIEIEHENGYVSRYFCDRNVTINVEAGEKVKAGEPLFAVTADQTQLHYQVLLEGEALNPFSVMKLEEQN